MLMLKACAAAALWSRREYLITIASATSSYLIRPLSISPTGPQRIGRLAGTSLIQAPSLTPRTRSRRSASCTARGAKTEVAAVRGPTRKGEALRLALLVVRPLYRPKTGNPCRRGAHPRRTESGSNIARSSVRTSKRLRAVLKVGPALTRRSVLILAPAAHSLHDVRI
jgi:hypothetical protein